MINETIFTVIIALAISAILYPIVIPFLRKLKFGQQVRNNGPQAHLKKQGTPAMGDLIIPGNIIITSISHIRDYSEMVLVLFVTVGSSIIGSLDDYIKIVMKHSEGLSPKQKILGQIIIAGIFTCYLMNSPEMGTQILIPLTGGFQDRYHLSLGIFSISFVFVVMLGTDNRVNFTDDLDRLRTSVTILVATFLTIVTVGENSSVSPTTEAVVGNLLGFLLLDVYSAKVFMGDTGSLTLGGFVSTNVFMINTLPFMPLIGLVYLMEVLSMMIQVTYFRRIGGKRIFKTAFIHRRFELCGWSETRIMAVLSIIMAIFCLIAYLGL